MKVIFLQKTTDEQGGSKASLRNTLRALSEQPDIEVELLAAAPGPLTAFAESLSIPVQIAPFPRWRNVVDRLFFNRTMRKFAKSIQGADWIVSNEMWWAPHAVALARYSGARSAAIIRDEIADLEKSYQYNFQKLDQIIAVSGDLKYLLQGDDKIFQQTRTIYNIVDRPESDAAVTAQLGVLCGGYPKVKRWILSAGTICPRKDPILAVQGLAELARRSDEDTGLLFVGGNDGSGYEEQLRQEVQAHGLEDRVAFAGHVSGIGSALDLAAVFLLTSHSEGLPRVLIEAGLAEVPSLSTQVSGVNEVYGANVKDYVLSTRDPIELAGKLEHVLDGIDADVLKLVASQMAERYTKTPHLNAWRSFLSND
jgi:glycosyltransferase involved in cell wall biosynthesis